RPPPTPPPFPYTTLFRSCHVLPPRSRLRPRSDDPDKPASFPARSTRRRDTFCAPPGGYNRSGLSGPDRDLLCIGRCRDHPPAARSEEHTSELQSLAYLVC